MKITLDNYEAYFLDYMEGQLNSEQLSELSLFLSLHHELKLQLGNSEIIPIQSDHHEFQHKSSIKKFDFQTTAVNKNSFNDFCIACGEQILTQEKVNELKTYCEQYFSQKTDFELFQKVYLKPQFNLKYPGKKHLYRKVIVHEFISTPIFRIALIAAGIALLIFINLVSSNKNENPKIQIIAAKIKEKILSKPSKISTAPLIVKNNVKKSSYKRIFSNTKAPLPDELIVETPTFDAALRNKEELYLAQVPSLGIKPIESQISNTAKVFVPSVESEVSNNAQTLTATVSNAIEKIKNDVINLDDIKDKKGNISLFKLAKAGITGINKITESNMSLTEKTDSTGTISAYSFNSEVIKFQKNLRN